MRGAVVRLATACCISLCACIAPSVIDSADRAVVPGDADLQWQPASRADLVGFFESVTIEGDAAASLWKIYYVFAEDGSFSGAALVLGAGNPAFQTLSGNWTLAGETLDFGDGQTSRVFSAHDHLKLESDGGIAVLRRAAVH